MFLLDTNVVSELMKQKPHAQVLEWFAHQPVEDVSISVITIGEIVYGFHAMSEGKKKERLQSWFEINFLEWIGNRIFPLGESIMHDWAEIKANCQRTLPLMDSLLAATALASGSTLITRNTKDFEGIERLSIANPWDA